MGLEVISDLKVLNAVYNMYCRKKKCQHVYTRNCWESCDNKYSVRTEIQNLVESINFPNIHEREKLWWLIGVSRESFCVGDLLIKIVNQDLCKGNFLENLKSHEVLIHVFADWTMIYFPHTFRETQSEWFGKQIISWHMNCVGICHPHSDDVDNSYKFNIISMIPLIY